MFRLLKIEWLKVKNYKAFWVFLALFVLGLLSINFLVYYIQVTFKQESKMPIEFFPYSYPSIWQTIGWISSWLLYFPGMLMILLITNEFNYRTHRQNIIDGVERNDFIKVKILVAVILAVLATIIGFFNVIIFGAVHGSSFSVEGSRFLFYTFIQNLNYILLAMLLGFLLRKSGLAIIIFFLFGLIFEQILWGLVDGKILNKAVTLYYFPLQSSDVLVGPPKFFGMNMYGTPPAEWILVLVSCFYICLYIFLTLRKFKKEDL